MIETEVEREDGRKGKAKEASGGSFAGTTGKQPTTRTTRTIWDAKTRTKSTSGDAQTW
jgi:hypothetical protein